MLISIAIQRNIISISPPVIDLNPKNITDHKMFRIICTPKMAMAIFTSCLWNPFLQTRNSAIPINMNRVVHIGPNAHAGGVHAGLFKTLKKLVMPSNVAKEPINPAIKGIRIDITSFTISSFLELSIIFPSFNLMLVVSNSNY